MIGVDILEVRKVAEMLKKMGWALPHRILGPLELQVYAELSDSNADSVRYLSRRLAAKEAIIKALRLPPDQDPRQIQILNTELGAPEVLYKNNTRTRVTISDCENYVVAFATEERE